jgi:hypothetical protein
LVHNFCSFHRVSVIFYFNDLSIGENGVLKSPTIIMRSSMCVLSFSKISFMDVCLSQGFYSCTNIMEILIIFLTVLEISIFLLFNFKEFLLSWNFKNIFPDKIISLLGKKKKHTSITHTHYLRAKGWQSSSKQIVPGNNQELPS